jgi:seryl-tRNA synthetase
MLDPHLFAHEPDTVRRSLRRRNAGPDAFALVDRLVELNARRRALIVDGDALRQQRNELSPRIGALLKEGRAQEAEAMKAEVRAASERAATIDKELEDVAGEEARHLLWLPNLVADDTPDGADEHGNVVVRRWGEPRPEGPLHEDIGETLGMYDPARAATIAGARFYVLTDGLARMERALVNFFLDLALEHGYREVMVPYLVTRQTMTGTGQLPKFEEDLFKLAAPISGQDAFLVPTAEVPVTNLHRDEILDHAALPVRYAAFTPCFRSEAGSYGRDTRGLIRLHQFHKVELVWFTAPEASHDALEALTGHCEAALQRLELPYQVVARCAGDVGNGGAKGYDLEVWLPGQRAYREISSCTNFGDFQARRLKCRFKREGEKRTTLVHTLNGSGLAVGRTLVAILENHVLSDGAVAVPSALVPYMGGMTRVERR